jgi:CHAP domain
MQNGISTRKYARRSLRALTLAGCLCSMAIVLYAPSASAAPAALPPAATAPSGLATSSARIVQLASDNVGRQACDTNSQGGHAYYTSCDGNNGHPEFWCADFAKWVWAQAGVTDLSGLNPAAVSFYQYGIANHTFTHTPSVGDAVVFSNSGPTSDIHHVAIVSEVLPGNEIVTISGDWGGDSGSEAHFASTSHVVRNAPAYPATVGSRPPRMGKIIVGFVAPVGGLTFEGASAVWTSDDTMSLVARGQDNAIYYREVHNAGRSWGSFHRIGGDISYAPSIVKRPDGTLDVFAVGVNGALYQTWKSPGSATWHALVNLGGKLTSAPSESWSADGTVLTLVARGSNGEPYVRTYNGSWGTFRPLNAQILGAPRLVIRPNGWTDVFATGTNGDLYQITKTGSTWPASMASQGGTLTSSPAAAWAHDGRTLTLAARGANGGLYARIYAAASSWQPYQALDATIIAAPEIVRRPDGSWDMIVVGTNHALYWMHSAEGVHWSAPANESGYIQ